MQRLLTVLIAAVVLPAWLHGQAAVQATSATDLFHEALHVEEVKGDLHTAIALYAQIPDRFPDDRSIAAQALVRMAQCYEKLGETEARDAYERVLRDYGDQSESVSVARVGLAAGGASSTVAPYAKRWVGRAPEIEAYLKEAEIVRFEDLGPLKRAKLAPGGLVEAFAWNPINPGANMAVYELDKLLGLEMVPVTIERRVEGEFGTAVMWVTPIQSDLGADRTPPEAFVGMWHLQLVRAKMFANLIHDTDRNLRNMLVDPAWNLILIDHARAFTTDTSMVSEISRVDRFLWERMQSLTEATLTEVLGAWLAKEQIGAILERRDRMADEINTLVEQRGEQDVFVR